MGKLTTQQLAYLASEFAQMAATLQKCQDAAADDPQIDLTAIAASVGRLTSISQNFVNQAIATEFEDSAQAYINLQTVTENANKVAASLTQETAQVSKLAGIAAGMIELAAAVTSGNVVTLGRDIAALAKAVHS